MLMTLDLCRNLKLLCFILIVKFTLICVATSDNEQRPQQNDEKRTESQKISEKLIAEHGGQMPTNELFSRDIELLNRLNCSHGGRELLNPQQQPPNEEHFQSDSSVQQRQQPLPFNINVPDLNEPDFSEVPTSMSSEVDVGLNPSLLRDIALHHQQKTEESSTGASENEPVKKQFTFDLNEFPPPDLVSSPPLPQQQTTGNLPAESTENNLNSPAAAENDQMAGETMPQDGGNKANAEGQKLCTENSVLEPQKKHEERESAKRVENSLGFNSSPTAAVVHPKQHQQQQTVVNLSQGNLEKNAATTVNENADRFSREYKKRFERGESSTATFPPPLPRPILSSAGEFFPGEFERQTADNRNVNEKIGESSVAASVYNPVQRTTPERGQQHNSLEIGSSSASQKLDKFRESITQILRLLAERRTLTRTNTTDTLHHRRGKRPISAVDEELETASNNPETEVNSIATKIRTSSRNKRQKKCICCSKLDTKSVPTKKNNPPIGKRFSTGEPPKLRPKKPDSFKKDAESKKQQRHSSGTSFLRTPTKISDYFKILSESSSKCNICKNILSGQRKSNWLQHLLHRHPREYLVVMGKTMDEIEDVEVNFREGRTNGKNAELLSHFKQKRKWTNSVECKHCNKTIRYAYGHKRVHADLRKHIEKHGNGNKPTAKGQQKPADSDEAKNKKKRNKKS